uniref:Ig-like domain-containing protein n=2 Tax=Leptobrachium leishanense TaxID=445787 RepID=A0A8C5MB63_9ANUR
MITNRNIDTSTLLSNMKSLILVLFGLDSLTCVFSQVTLTESGPGVLKPSESLFVTCKVSASLSDYWWFWIRQPLGGGLEYLAQIYPDGQTYYSQSLRSRLTITIENSKNEFYLKVTGMQTKDSGTYYCARYTMRN